MAVKYVPYGSGNKVSRRWFVVLTEADRDKVGFHLTSGHRTMDEQAALFRQNMIRPGVPKPGRPLTAVPSSSAPHIRVGRAAHAIDVNSLDGGETRLQRWLERQGARPTNPVRGEAWHLELSDGDLERLSAKFQERARRRKKAAQKKKAAKKKAPTRLDKGGVEFIVRQEGEVLHLYDDSKGFATFGIGHLIDRKPVASLPESVRRKYGTKQHPLPRAKALALSRKHFAEDARRFERAVAKVPARWRGSPDRFAALFSVAFNFGESVLTPAPPLTMLGKALHGTSLNAVKSAWNELAARNERELRARRGRELALFLRNR